MPEVIIKIGGREFEVACQEGEEHYLHSAAKMLDDEAQALASQIGRIPEPRMLLMAGLMLADRTAAMEDKVREKTEELAAATAQIEQRDSEIAAMKAAPPPEPVQVEVPVIPEIVTDTLAEIAARAESLASAFEEKASA